MAKTKKIKTGTVLGAWIVEGELIQGGSEASRAAGPGTWYVLAIGREKAEGYVISNLHVQTDQRFAIVENEQGDFDLKPIDRTDWVTIHGKPGRRVFRVARTLRTSPTVAPLVEGL